MRKWQRIKDEYLTFTVSEKVGIAVLLFLIILVNAMILLVPGFFSPPKVDCTAFEEFVSGYNANLDQISQIQNEAKINRVEGAFDSKNKHHSIKDYHSFRLFEFDPNQVTEEELIDLGFNKYQRENLIKYRLKGGYFYKPADLLKIYGVDSTLFNRLVSCIKWNDQKSLRVDLNLNNNPIDINCADSAIFVALPGLSPYLARRICRYRSLLGGFVAKEQLLEVYGINDSIYSVIEPFLNEGTKNVSRIRVNFADYNEMVRHPYVDKAMASSVLRLRRLFGPITLKRLLESNDIDSLKVERMREYLNFD